MIQILLKLFTFVSLVKNIFTTTTKPKCSHEEDGSVPLQPKIRSETSLSAREKDQITPPQKQ